MNREALAAKLRTLAQSDEARSKTARLRDVIEDVETALAAGVSRERIVQELGRHGLEMSLATFAGTLRRLRKRRRASPALPPSTARDRGPVAEDAPAVSEGPAALDRIINSTPDLGALAKVGKRSTRK